MGTRFLKFSCLLTLLFLLGTITPIAAPAAGQQPAAPTAAEDRGPLAKAPAEAAGETASLALAIVKVVASLALVVGLMLLLAHLAKKIGLSTTAAGHGSLIRVLDNRMIAPKRHVAVLAIGKEYVLVGITDQSITLLSRLENTDELDRLLEERQEGRATGLGSSFAALLHKAGQAVNNNRKQEEK